ncbi:type I restriction enzyme M protein [Williamsoniiplasma luminosum]|uniref:site-specific DNA-methyltransferase (adenine-specific) n=1 Tax=Williamsoniiplasma luminosum TaxID=214888 RepID=A0A2K8NWY7_9MOLU|nr:type I restriction-modification system subunit M [Williamsoniiplasma luminosum]ATZ17143.1 type I restriction enzyme M protein [Williamsoniiplasma luminosum]
MTTKNKSSQEREALHNAIWKIANDLRGSVDGWDFKQYILGTIFYRFISENISNYINQNEWNSGNKAFDYSLLTDEQAKTIKEEIVKSKGFFIYPTQLFNNVVKNAIKDENLNETLEKTFKAIESTSIGTNSEKKFKGLFDDFDTNNKKLGDTVNEINKRLIQILTGIANLDLGDFTNNSIDAFGDAYEFLMTMYASNAGKSGGEFFTPQEVSELIAKITLVGKDKINKVYDPACGSGSLLLQFSKIIGEDNIIHGFYGQELNLTTYNLARMNMFLHNVGFDKFDIARQNTLTNPQHLDDAPFDAIVSNPPYSTKWDGDADPVLINDPRFSPAGVLAPKSKADLAFVMHILSMLSNDGVAAIVSFPGTLYRGGAEAKIRKYLVDNNYVDAIIQLPPNLFFGTSISTCIMVLKKSKKDSNVLFIDASNLFRKVNNANKLDPEHIEKILEIFKNQKEVLHMSKLVDANEIANEDYNLSVNTYVQEKEDTEIIDIKVLNQEIKEISERSAKLRLEIDKIIAEIEADED